MAAKIQLRRDTAANWAANNPILGEGEMGLVTDTMKVKVGNGTTAFNSLPFYITQNSGTTIISASFNGDDIEFTLDNLGVVKIVGGKTDITGPRGIQGLKGVGIVSVIKTGTVGLVDTYTITYTDASTDTFDIANGVDGTNGNGISSVTLISTVGKVKTYRITFTDATTFDYTVTDGADGTGIGDISGSGTANEIAYFTAEKTIDNLPVATYPSLAELAYVKGVTSSIQTQINGKVPTTRTLTINGTGLDLSADRSWTITAGGSYWTAMPGTPTRVANDSLTLTDTSNTNKYDLLLSRLTVMKRTESSGTVIKQAMVEKSSYATNVVTLVFVGDIMTTSLDAGSIKYGAVKAKAVNGVYIPMIGTGTDVMGTFQADTKYKVHGSIGYHKSAGTTGATTYDIKKNGTTMFTTKPSVASGATIGNNTSGTDTATGSITPANTTSYLDTGDNMTFDVVSVSTAAPTYATIKVFVSNWNDIYLA